MYDFSLISCYEATCIRIINIEECTIHYKNYIANLQSLMSHKKTFILNQVIINVT